jgi:hypothetical protein
MINRELNVKKGDWLVNSRHDVIDFEKIKIVERINYSKNPSKNIMKLSDGIKAHPYKVDYKHATYIDRVLNALKMFKLLRFLRIKLKLLNYY